MSRDSLYRCGLLSAHCDAALLIALVDLESSGLVQRADPAALGCPYTLTRKGAARLSGARSRVRAIAAGAI